MCGCAGYIRRECPLQPVGEELARLESDEISGLWWDPMLSISGYTNHMCVTVSAEQELLDFSEDTVSNQSLFTSFEQDSADHTVPHTLFMQISTLPSFAMLPPASRNCPSVQGAIKKKFLHHFEYNYIPF